MKPLRLSTLSLRWCFAAALFAALVRPAYAGDETLDARLSAIDRRADGVRDLTADFTEEKFTVLLKEPMVSKGRVRVLGSRTRWDTTSPRRTTMFTDERDVVLYFPEREAAEVYPIDRRLQPLVVSPIPRVATLRKHFELKEISDDDSGDASRRHLLLELAPTSDTLAEHIDDVRVRIDTRLGLADRVEVIDAEGDRTVITFSNLRTNVGLSEQEVARDLPEGTEITRPLEGKNDNKPDAARSERP